MNKHLLAAAGAAALALGAMNGAAAADAAKVEALLKQHNCVSCHGTDKKILGPAYKDVAKKYKGQKNAVALLVKKVKAGGKGAWGPVPMPPNDKAGDADIKLMVEWILSL